MNQQTLEQQFKQAVEAYYALPTAHMDVFHREGEQAFMAKLQPLIKAAEKQIMDARSQLSEWFPDHPLCGVIDLDLYYLNRNHPMIWEILDSEYRQELDDDEAYNEALTEIQSGRR